MKRFNFKQLPILFILGLVIFAACGSESSDPVRVNPLAPASDLPEEVAAAPAAVQEAYRFAIANPEILKQIPCYCGCGAVGHKNNFECYVSTTDENGKPVFEGHALG